MMVCCKRSARNFATMRATTSVPPPAGYGTIILIVPRVGHSWATDDTAVRANRPTAATSAGSIFFIVVSLFSKQFEFLVRCFLPSMWFAVEEPERFERRPDRFFPVRRERAVGQPG